MDWTIPSSTTLHACGAIWRMATVTDTAFLVAEFRARESARPDALFLDPFAGRLAGERGSALIRKVAHLGEMAGWSTVVRTVLIDRFLNEAIERGTKAVLNVGAGLDARPYRMSLPSSLFWFEVDLAPVIEHKETVLANESPRCRLRRLALDIVDATARQELLAWLSTDETPALVLAEGVFPYLQPDDVARILDDLQAHQAIQNLIVDYLSPELIRARSVTAVGPSNVSMPFAPEDWQGFFAARGWKVRQMGDLAEEGKRRGRPFAMPEAMRAIAQAQVGTEPSKSQGTFAAYALMERA